MHIQLVLAALVALWQSFLVIQIVVNCYLATVNLHWVSVWAHKVQLLVVYAQFNSQILELLRHMLMMGSQCLDAIVFGWSIWVEFQITFLANISEVHANFIVGFEIILKNLFTAVVGARMHFELACFLMIYSFFIRKSEIKDFLYFETQLNLLVLMELTAFHHAEKSPRHELVFDISMQVLIFWLIAFHWALGGIHCFPFSDTIGAESRLTGRALLRVEKNLEADRALEIGFVLL